MEEVVVILAILPQRSWTYPNPNSGVKLYYKVSDPIDPDPCLYSSIENIEIFSIDGKVYLKEETNSKGDLDIRNMPGGMYILRFTDLDGKVMTKNVLVDK